MATLYERYQSGATADLGRWDTRWGGQTFTPSVSHTITSVKLFMRRDDLPGTMTVSIKATDGGGLPTGADLTSGTTDADTLPEYPASREWREISFGAGTVLTASTTYAIVFRTPDTDLPNQCRLGIDQTSPTYAGGATCNSSDSGGSWAFQGVDTDALFEEYGDPIGTSTVTTEANTNTIATSSTGWGHITVIGADDVTQHGHVWSTSQSPTTSDSKTELGAKPQTGNFTSGITGLTPGTTYYIRAYAVGSSGANYGSQVSITTLTTIRRAHIWSEGSEFHYFDEAGVERVLQGHETASDKDIWPWLDPFS